MESLSNTPAHASLRWRLPLLVVGLIGVVMVALLTAAYFEIRSTLVHAGEERAQGAADQLADLLARAGEQRLGEVQRVAADSAVRRYLRVPPVADEATALESLRSLTTTGQQRVELWTAGGELALSLSVPTGADSLVPTGAPPFEPGSGPLRARGGTLFSEVTAAVPAEPEGTEPLGFVVARRVSTTAGSSDVLGRLVGSSASVAIGSGSVWTDLSKIVPAPPEELMAAGVAVYDGPDGVRQLGAVSVIAGMPSAVWVGFPYGVLVAPAVSFMTRMGTAAAVFILVAMGFTALMTRRITRPLTDLTDAAEALAAGRLVSPVTGGRRDEIGRLASAFNRMSERVQAAHERLAARARELTQSEARKAAILESAMDAVVTMDQEGRIVEFNPAAERIFGHSRERALGTPLADVLIPPSLRARHREGLARYLATGDARILDRRLELPALRADGSEFPSEVSVTRIPQDGPPLFTAFIRDLTHQKEAERALRLSEARFQRIFESGIVGIMVADLAGAIVEANDAFLEMVRYSRDELSSGAIRSSDMTPPEWMDATQAALTVLTRDGMVSPYEKEYIRKDGSRLPVIIGAAMLDSTLSIAVVHDITQHKEFEAERARGIRLEAENRRIEEANRLKSEFLANMSHELRTPLNAVIGFAEILHDGAVQPGMPEYQEFLNDILTSARHLLQLINDVLDLSKVEAGKIEFRPEPVNLVQLVGELVGILRTATADGGIRVETDLAPEVRELVIDAARLKQVLYNYLSNAIKFTPSGGRVTIRARPEGTESFRLEVDDTGIGIASEDLDRLFVEFQQLDAGAAKAHAGTGLGLALTRRLVEAQGGRVGVSSRPGAGSTFWAVLPRRNLGTAVLSPRSYAGAHASAPTVLVVEDNARDQELIVRLLREQGYAVETASTASHAVARCRERAFDAITLDLLLPDGSGLGVLRAIRAQGANRDVPVIVVTVVTEPGSVAGFAVHDILVKPLDENALLDSMRRAGVPPEREGSILVVDDDLNSLKLMVRALRQSGYEARGFNLPAEGLEAAADSPPLAVVLDLMMPELDGFEFLDRFRGLAECRTVPVIVWTVKDLTADEHARICASAQAFMDKERGAAPVVEELRAFVGAFALPAPMIGEV